MPTIDKVVVKLAQFKVEKFIEKNALKRSGKMEMETRWLDLAVPAIPGQTLLIEEIEKTEFLKSIFFEALEIISLKQATNPLVLIGAELEKFIGYFYTTEFEINGVKAMKASIYNSTGYSLELEKGIYLSQALLHTNEDNADATEINLINLAITDLEEVVIYRLDKIVGFVAMLDKDDPPTPSFFNFVECIKKNGFSTTVTGLKLPK